MKVVFLCGGIGKRMFPVTEDKFLLKFIGKTLLEHQVELAKKAGLTDFIIVAGAKNVRRIANIMAGISDIRFKLTVQEEPRGIANALESAATLLDDAIILVNPNDVFNASAYTKLLDAHRANNAVAYMLGYEVKEYFPGGYLEVNPEDTLTHIVEKPGKGNEPSHMVNVLVHLHTDPEKLLRHVANVLTNGDDVYERALDGMVKENQTIKVIPFTGPWTPIKYPWHIFPVVRQFLDQTPGYIAPTAYISEKATVEGRVYIEDNVRVLENAVIRGPVYIGPNSVIGNSSLVRGYSHLGSDCVVGFATEVKGAYIGDKCWFHMCYVGDSIIGDGCSFGAGTVFANWRFNEENITVYVEGERLDSGRDKFGAIVGDNCRTGVNVSLMPGVKVGPNSIIGPQTCLTNDLEPDSIAIPSGYRSARNKFKISSETAENRIQELRH
jgi:NDP-sugar pyrophosphorylase family protein